MGIAVDPLRSWLRGLATSLVAAVLLLAAARAAEPAPSDEDEAFEVPAPAYLTLMLARDPAVHADLGLSAHEEQAARAAVAEVDNPLWQLRDVPVAQSSEKLEELRAKLRERLEAALSKEQIQRFDQLVIQARGAKALVAPDVRARLQLSDKQFGKLKAIVAGAKSGTLDSQKVVAALSEEQRATLSKMFGKRFDLSRVTQVGCVAPEFRSVDAWINGPPLSMSQLAGKVVVVHFWAFNCSNCINNLPHYQAWHEKFPPSDVTIVGIHTPETSAEREVNNLRANVKERGIKYPVAVDGSAENWKVWGNRVWPSVYLVDRQGKVRAWWYGELNWQGARGEEKMRHQIEALLAEK